MSTEKDVLLEAAREMRERSEALRQRGRESMQADGRSWTYGEALGWRQAAELLERKAQDDNEMEEVT